MQIQAGGYRCPKINPVSRDLISFRFNCSAGRVACLADIPFRILDMGVHRLKCNPPGKMEGEPEAQGELRMGITTVRRRMGKMQAQDAR